MFKRLSGPTGVIAEPNAKPTDTPERAVRSAILVHSGPNGTKNTLASSDGDIEFSADRIRNVVKNHNDMITRLANQYGGFDKMPTGAYPPLLDQHADDSNDRIRGRLNNLLRFEIRDVPKVGKNVACAVTDITFLGGETVKQLLDGRIFHLSVGIDENSDTLGETSTVIEPAAPGAMVLSKKKLKIQRIKRMSEKRLAKLAALKGELKTLTDKTVETKKRAHLAKRKIEVSNHFTKLMADKKMSPAEFKKVDLTRLAKLDKASFEDVLHVYDIREPLVKSGQQGSSLAENFADMGIKSSEDREVKRLKAAAKKNLSKQGMKFKASEDDAVDETSDELTKLASAAPIGGKADLQGGNGDMGMDAEADQAADVQDREELMQQIEENSTQIARVASMVEAIIEEMNQDGDDDAEEPAAEENAELESQGDEEKSDDDAKDKSEYDDKKDLDKLDKTEKDKNEGDKD